MFAHCLWVSMVAVFVGCGGGGSSGSIKTPGKLLFTVQPTDGTVGVSLAAVEISVHDSSGQPISDGEQSITITLVSKGGKAKVSGTLTVKAVGGRARFDSLKIDAADPECVLQASAAGFAAGISASFDIASPTLNFAVEPKAGTVGAPLADVKVEVIDRDKKRIVDAVSPITIALVSKGGKAKISGTLTVTAVAGLAGFSGLKIDLADSDCKLRASSPGFDTADSASFDIASPTLKFTRQPVSVGARIVLPTVEVSILDRTGELIPDAEYPVTIELAPNTGKATIAGAVKVKAVGGLARFETLKVIHDQAINVSCLLQASAPGTKTFSSSQFTVTPTPPKVILMIADGWGYQHIEATDKYTKKVPVYDSWTKHPMATWDLTTKEVNAKLDPPLLAYDSEAAWSNWVYLVNAATDSAAAATAMYTGEKTDNSNVSVSGGDKSRLLTLSEMLAAKGVARGAVSSVPISHATPGALFAHNSERHNYYAIADETLFGDPNTTGTPSKHKGYAGGYGSTFPLPDVLIGAGHPEWIDLVKTPDLTFVHKDQLAELRSRSGRPGEWTLVERIGGKTDAAARLMATASNPKTQRLCGLFGGKLGNIELRMADGSGANPENPTLAEMSQAALAVLERKPKGFFLVIEGGAVDWGSHAQDLDVTLGEMIGFNEAVKAVTDWVDDPNNTSSWANTLVIVTGDHDCGGLWPGPLQIPYPKQGGVLGEVSARTLKLEKAISLGGQPTPFRASWEDTNSNAYPDPTEKVYWMWNTPSHVNSLIPLYTKGIGSSAFKARAVYTDKFRGEYIENTDVFHVMKDVFR